MLGEGVWVPAWLGAALAVPSSWDMGGDATELTRTRWGQVVAMEVPISVGELVTEMQAAGDEPQVPSTHQHW